MQLSRHAGRRTEGQAAITFAVMLFLFAGLGVAALDVGFLLSDRSDAQGDVDDAALAGALELTLSSDPGTQADEAAAAIARATQWAQDNGIDPLDGDTTLTVTTVRSCFSADDGGPTGVQVTVDRRPNSYFVGLFGIAGWRVRATATACAGRPVDMVGFLPFALSLSSSCFMDDAQGNRVPQLGEQCDLVVDNNVSGLAGELGVEIGGDCPDGNSSSAVLRDNIRDGVTARCGLGDSVQGNPGHNVGPTSTALEDRLANEGACESNFSGSAVNFTAGSAALSAVSLTPLKSPSRADGYDDFFEVWVYDPTAPHPAANLVPYDCDPTTSGQQTSPRNVTLLVVSDFAAPDGNEGPKSYIVRGFARIYIEGCTDKNAVFHKGCNGMPGGKFTIHGRFVEQLSLSNSNLGLRDFGDVEVFLRQ